MRKSITGQNTLRIIDGAIAGLRRQVGDAIVAAENIDAREAQIRDGQVTCYTALAGIRLDLMRRSDDADDLDRAHRKAARLLDQHDVFIAEQSTALDSASEQIRTLEEQRVALSEEHDAAIAAYEVRVAEVEAKLLKSKPYRALAVKAEAQAAIATRAHQKLEIARDDLEQKGASYRSDPLFQYLWKRNYRKAGYKAPPITRFLDGWVARLCKYDQAYPNYGRLTDLPDWLEQHAAEQDKQAEIAESTLEAAELKALKTAGADKLQTTADALLGKIEATDLAIVTAEDAHGALAARQVRLRNEEEGPAREARRILEDSLRQASFPDLRILAAETLALDDDQLVDQLVNLRREEMSLEIEADRLEQRPDELRQDLSSMEQLRRKFKSARLDSPYARFKPAAIDDILTALSVGRLNANDAFRQLQRIVRRQEPRTQPGFGGSRRSRTIGLPDILGDVIWEVAKQAGQSRRGSATRFPTRRRTRRSKGPRISIPPRRSPPSGGRGRRGGGFKTGGGF